jgi:hypothetical protein
MTFGANVSLTGSGTNGGGRGVTTNRLLSTPTLAAPIYVAIGTGAYNAGGRTAGPTDTALTTEVFQSGSTRQTGTPTQQTTTTTNDTFQVVGTVIAAASWVVNEAALFNNATGGSGDMYLSATFANVSLNTGDSIQSTLKVQYS